MGVRTVGVYERREAGENIAIFPMPHSISRGKSG
jgi:hypothetical protein